jgi:hypothetical protein
MNEAVKMFKGCVQLFLEYDNVRGFFLFDEPLFVYQGDIGIRLFEDPLEGG